MAKKAASDFEKIINDGRERKRNEILAQRIFGKDRRQSAPPSLKPGTGPSLASRVGVKKRVSSVGPKPKPIPAGDVNGEWTHDLHATVNEGGSLAGRIAAPGTGRRQAATQRAQRLAAAIEARPDVAARQLASLAATTTTVAPRAKGLSIRGLAGPFSVLAQNFAPGTTAADIESAMTPVGGEMLSCVILKSSPMIVAEMVFASKEGGEAVIETFNNQTADGRIIKVFPKPGGYHVATATRAAAPLNPPSGPRAQRETRSSAKTHVVDGSQGFNDDLMETDDGRLPRTDGGLYSDNLVGSNRRGRGFRGGRGGR